MQELIQNNLLNLCLLGENRLKISCCKAGTLNANFDIVKSQTVD